MRLVDKVESTVNESLVYTWGEISLETSVRLSRLGQRVVREKFNCAKRLSSAILADAYRGLRAAAPPMSAARLEKEQRELALADAIFCPSPLVRDSLVEIGIDPGRLLDTSYGWEPARFSMAPAPAPERRDRPTLLFVGTVCVRKGAHLLLEAWRDAKVGGRLVLVGDIEPLIRERYGDILARSDVTYLPYTKDIGALYRGADWFVFPTLEEGSPLVTYEAAGNGLPLLVSPMGAGAFVRDRVDGIVIDRMTVSAWASAIRMLPDIGRERDILAANARERAEDYTYEKVGARRRTLLHAHFG